MLLISNHQLGENKINNIFNAVAPTWRSCLTGEAYAKSNKLGGDAEDKDKGTINYIQAQVTWTEMIVQTGLSLAIAGATATAIHLGAKKLNHFWTLPIVTLVDIQTAFELEVPNKLGNYKAQYAATLLLRNIAAGATAIMGYQLASSLKAGTLSRWGTVGAGAATGLGTYLLVSPPAITAYNQIQNIKES